MTAYAIEQLDEERNGFQTAFDSAQDAKRRNRQGQFATPNILAREIAQATLALFNDLPLRFFEPSIGTGSFFSAILHAVPHGELVSAVGIEIDQELAAKAKEYWSGCGLRVINGDFGELPISVMGEAPTLILANPPYVRHHHLRAESKRRLQARVAREVGVAVNGLAGLYVYFVLLASHRLAPGGLATWLIPSEFMDVNYGSCLRQYLTSQVTLLRIHRFDPAEVQFDDAMVSSAVVFLKREPTAPNHRVQFSYGGTLSNPAVVEDVAIERLQSQAKWTGHPRQGKDVGNATPLATTLHLGDLFRVQRGIATGANEMFILPLSEARQRGIHSDNLRPVLPSPRYLKETVIHRGDAGYPAGDNPLTLIDCSIPEQQLHRHDPALWEYLNESRFDDLKGRYLLNKRTPWYRQEQREAAMFLCTYMGRGRDEARPFRFVLNESDAIATNLYLMLQARGKLATQLRASASLRLAVLEGLSQITAANLKSAGRVYGGGLHKIEPKELANLCVDHLLEFLPTDAISPSNAAGLFDLLPP